MTVEFKQSDYLEFHVGDCVFKTWPEACAHAMQNAVTRGESQVDVVIFDEAGAFAWGGSDAIERYREDPEASVFERFEIRVNCVGRVP